MAQEKLVFHFRPLNDNIPDNWTPFVHWQVECHPDSKVDLPFPMGIAWVSDYSKHHADLVSLDFIIVMDQYRRNHIATALINKCKERWPSIMLTDAISPAGERLLNSIDPNRSQIKLQAIAARNLQRKKDRKAKKFRRKR